ncbi:hypothetical protein NFI96_012747 [Prochilodus magdalenae]|nr:hypothetical protein NFI96_012747 [Prochilodus magdalenae]
MFLCSGARSTGAVAGIFRYNFGGKAQVGKKLTNLLPPPPSAATWTLQDKLRRLCCPRVHDALCVVSERLEDVFKCTGWKYSLTPGNVIRAPRIMCALESGPALTEFNVFCFPWMRKKKKAVDILCVSEHIFARNTELCTTHAFMDKVRPNALSAPAKGEPDIQSS